MLKLFFFIFSSICFSDEWESIQMSPHLKGSENFLGKKFEGNFINSTISNPLIDVIQFERILNGKAISITHSVNHGEYGGKYLILWNSDKEKVESYFFSTGGEIVISPVTILENEIVIEEDFSKNENSILKVKKIYNFDDVGNLRKKIKYLINNVWINAHNMEYIQNNSVEVIFK